MGCHSGGARVPAASLPRSEDPGPCPLPFYPVLGEPSVHGGALPSELLSSPSWRLRWVYTQNQVLPGAHSTSEPRPALATGGLLPWSQKKPEASSGELDRAEGPELLWHQQLPFPRTPLLATEGGRRAAGAHPSEPRRPLQSAQGSAVRAFAGCLRWIAHTAYTFSCRLRRSIFGTKEP
ncbi:annexin-2 receptor [Suricata suricatta]|uniref:annexin-2 receptor n=1 Tax=Suricata suricatta TaxID=37032 RepID=UPI00115552B9|nr:annexin-2 receptor [Suricata suricatta]